MCWPGAWAVITANVQPQSTSDRRGLAIVTVASTQDFSTLTPRLQQRLLPCNLRVSISIEEEMTAIQFLWLNILVYLENATLA